MQRMWGSLAGSEIRTDEYVAGDYARLWAMWKGRLEIKSATPYELDELFRLGGFLLRVKVAFAAYRHQPTAHMDRRHFQTRIEILFHFLGLTRNPILRWLISLLAVKTLRTWHREYWELPRILSYITQFNEAGERRVAMRFLNSKTARKTLQELSKLKYIKW